MPACGKCEHGLPWLVKTTDINFLDDLETPLPVLVDFWADWCGPCHAIAPELEKLSRDLAGKLKILKLNIDENPMISNEFNVRSIPTLILFKDAKVLDTFVGAMSKGAMLERIRPHIN